MTSKPPRRTFTEEFKQQLVQLYNSGKARATIIEEYKLPPSVFNRQVARINTLGSTKEANNRSPEQAEVLRLRKEVQCLLMENDILKQVALIMGQKSNYKG